MIGILGGEERLPPPVEADAIEEAVIGVAALFYSLSAEIDRPCPLVDVHDGFDIAIATRDAILELPGGEIVQVEVNPTVAFRPPDQLVRAGQHAPVLRDADLAHLRLRLLLEQRAHGARARIGHAHPRVLVIARARDECDRRSVGIPEEVADPSAAGDVVADHRAMGAGRHLEPHQLWCRTAHVDHHALNPEDDAVAGERVSPRLHLRRADLRANAVRATHPAPVVLERGDLARVGRPRDDRLVALDPAGVVRSVAEVLDAVRRQRRLGPAREVREPEIVVANEHGTRAVGRQDRIGRRRAARGIDHRAAIGGEIAAPALLDFEDELAIRREIKGGERQAVACHPSTQGRRHALREPCMIERRCPRPAPWIHQHELPPGGGRDPVGCPSVRQPARPAGHSTHQRASGGAEGALGTGVVVRGQRASCLRPRGGGEDVAKQNGDESYTWRAHLERLLRRYAKGNYFFVAGSYVFTIMPLAYSFEWVNRSAFRSVKIRIPRPIATGFTKMLSSSMRSWSIKALTNVAPP